jgi:hypothetical protein
MVYSSSDVTELHKAENGGMHNIWLGNPAQHTGSWGLVTTYNSSQLLNTGITIGNLVIKQDSRFSVKPRTVYIVNVPPYYLFEQVSTDNGAIVPYDYDRGDADSNIAYRYMPTLIGNVGNGYYEYTTQYNPYRYYEDIGTSTFSNNEIDANLSNFGNSGVLNDVTFNITPNLYAMTHNGGNDTRYGFIVKGIYARVSSYVGLYNSTDSGAHSTPIYAGHITDIPVVGSVTNVVSQPIIFDSMDASGGINFRMAQFPADI